MKGLYAIIDRSVSPVPLIDLAKEYFEGGTRVVQLRDKKRLESAHSRESFWKTAKQIVALKQQYSFLFIVNDDLEAVREVRADGIHVGKDDPSIQECRQFLGREKLIGYSSHSLEEAIEAEKNGADYVAFGAIFPTPTKGPGHPVQGIEKLREVVKAVSIPVVAIGGIDRGNIKEVLSTGVASVAMISALAKAKDRVTEARFFGDLFQ